MKDYSLKINGHNYDVQIDDVNEASTLAHVVVNGVSYEVEIGGAKAAASTKPQVAPAAKGANSAMITPATAAPSPRLSAVAPSSGYAVKCPLPGTVLSVKVNVGDTVSRGQTLVILEAMKMENEIVAPRDGTIAQVVTAKGAVVETGAPLIVLA